MDQRSGSREKLVNTNTVAKGARPASHRRAQSAIWLPGVALIVIVLLSLGIWGIIWLAVALLASVWER
jgi:hypothetical protein